MASKMKKSHEAAMHASHESHKRSHHYSHPGGHGMSEAEGAVMGHGQFANLPQDVKMDLYPPASMHKRHVLDDTMSHVDHTNHHAESQADKYVSYQH